VGAIALADALQSNSTVTDLNIFCTPQSLLGNNIASSHLRTHVPIANEIGDDGATAMAEMLRVNRTLLKLNLDGTWIICERTSSDCVDNSKHRLQNPGSRHCGAGRRPGRKYCTEPFGLARYFRL
jgi:hypothetical protein